MRDGKKVLLAKRKEDQKTKAIYLVVLLYKKKVLDAGLLGVLPHTGRRGWCLR